MRSTAEVLAYVRKLSGLLRHLHICQADMSKSQLRVDLNISVRPSRSHPQFNQLDPLIGGTKDSEGRGLGTRVEVKNLNSFQSMLAAINFEFNRQIKTLTSGQPIDRETRAFDANRGETTRLRSKEDLLDYRFCPDPDLPLLQLSQDFLDRVQQRMPELPEHITKRWREQLGLSKVEAGMCF
jgi:aspartyl-tRNA(Asn)/glutamyl-tRNA(Gln) amidotransferase subunit B